MFFLLGKRREEKGREWERKKRRNREKKEERKWRREDDARVKVKDSVIQLMIRNDEKWSRRGGRKMKKGKKDEEGDRWRWWWEKRWRGRKERQRGRNLPPASFSTDQLRAKSVRNHCLPGIMHAVFLSLESNGKNERENEEKREREREKKVMWLKWSWIKKGIQDEQKNDEHK